MVPHFNGLVQDCSNFIANALELLQSYNFVIDLQNGPIQHECMKATTAVRHRSNLDLMNKIPIWHSQVSHGVSTVSILEKTAHV